MSYLYGLMYIFFYHTFAIYFGAVTSFADFGISPSSHLQFVVCGNILQKAAIVLL